MFRNKRFLQLIVLFVIGMAIFLWLQPDNQVVETGPEIELQAEGQKGTTSQKSKKSTPSRRNSQFKALTDVAPAQRNVNPESRNLDDLDLEPTPQPQGIEPDGFDVQNPPSWTKPLAKPNLNPTPPDPFTAPPIKVDPRRLPKEDN